MTKRTLTLRQRGAIGLISPMLLVVFLSVGAIAVDVAHLYVVRNELQNAADAAALAGAAGLYPANPTPQWTNAVTKGTNAVQLNASDGTQLATGTVVAGYWNLTGSPAGMQAQTITPGTNDVPGVQVTITRASGVNGGAVKGWLTWVFGGGTADIRATAVAVMAAPGTANPGALFPVALNKCLFDLYWNYTTNQPLIDPSTGKPYVIDIDASYPASSPTCASGEWTGFGGATDANTEKGLVTSGNPTTVSIGDSINISTGVKTSVYNAIPPLPYTVTMPVVANVVPGSSSPVVAFAGFTITRIFTNGTHSYIEGNFTTNTKVSGGGSGTNYGAYVPPRLAN
ncbi:TadG family pilus assembly protein [Ralstonia sp. NFACC01]|uniref:pilus assembly protein TadG-related protein n=1 Tax=Ralstonia sp. NFACC01 TaxID=1566294 RepID=UPI0008F32E10|nr:TadG family pilus assembly protein [Ralstonia sp. NFACC01]SFP44511.1 Putative Flp pilus-assembly TadE/G-like [Ralstonia sp. NFACC01]